MRQQIIYCRHQLADSRYQQHIAANQELENSHELADTTDTKIQSKAVEKKSRQQTAAERGRQ
jgi:hypothetical protein